MASTLSGLDTKASKGAETGRGTSRGQWGCADRAGVGCPPPTWPPAITGSFQGERRLTMQTVDRWPSSRLGVSSSRGPQRTFTLVPSLSLGMPAPQRLLATQMAESCVPLGWREAG